MRFRAQISQVGLMQKITKSLSQTSKSCILKLSPESVGFIVTGNEAGAGSGGGGSGSGGGSGGTGGVQIWSQVKIKTLFDEYRIESRSNNEIYLELISLDALGKALRSAEAAGAGSTHNSHRSLETLTDAEVYVKLGKKNNKAVLIFEIKGNSHTGFPLEITHDVSCVVLSPGRVQDLKEPMCPPPDVHIQLPSLDKLKGMASRMSRMGTIVKVSANNEGTMSFSIESSGLSLETTWEKLKTPQFSSKPDDPDQEAADPPDPSTMFSVSVGVKAILKLLSTNISNSTTIACISHEYCLIAYIYIGDPNENAGVLTLFIPSMEA